MGMMGFGEILPHPENRITLDKTKKDKWGLNVLAIDCELRDNEKKMRIDMKNDAVEMLTAAGIKLDGASDHGVSEALYLRDPDHNGLELYWDRPQIAWPRTSEGELAMFTAPLDLEGLLAA